MATSRLRFGAPPVGYTIPRPGTAESERVQSYRARKAVVRRLEQLIAAGKYDQAITFALPITALLDGIPVDDSVQALLDELQLADGEDDVEQAKFRRDPKRRRALITRLQRTLQLLSTAIPALQAMEDPC